MVSKKSVAIVGGGIAGLTTAYFLAKKDYKITVFDPEGIATQCSYANGGQLSVCNAETWNTYSNLIKGIKWMSKNDAPLAFRNDIWSWDKFRWVVGFVGATLTNSYDYNTRKTIEWSLRSRRLYKKLIKELNIDFHQKDCGILHIYKNEKSWYKAQKTLERFKDTGWGRVVKKGNLLKYKIKTKEIVGATFTKGDSVGDIHTFCKELSNYLYNNYDYRIHVNKIVANKEIKYLSGRRDHAKTIDELKKEFDEVVVCAGAYTPFILPHLNIYPIKGYSVTYHEEHDMPTTSILDDDAKIVASPFANNVFRVAGTAELAGWNHDIRMDRIKPLRRWVRKNTFVKDSRPENWACLRPMTPNMMPIVTKTKGVWVNSGAGHLGWTMGMALAEKVTNGIFKS